MGQQLPISLSRRTMAFTGMGRSLGYPTANIETDTQLSDGVYFGWADLGKYTHHPALIFIGTPTTMGDVERRAEAHLLDIDDTDHYGLELKLSVEVFHRPNQTFSSVDELLVAIKADETAGRDWAHV